MGKIKVMDELLANKIAAGEVVEKCCSVVKELVENSIDASSTEIRIDLKDAGTSSIKVTDNGIGMEKEDAILAFSRHATSKIVDEDDLFHINTLGFRGEALAAISSVSNIILKTSTGGVGCIVEIHGGKIVKQENGDARKGTMISVNDLFYNTPARLKHLRSLYAELANISEYINKLALSHPEIRFTLTNNDNILLQTDGSNNLLKTIKSIYGLQVAKKMVPVSAEDDDYVINGYISLPEVHRSSRNHIVILVNGRIVKNTDLNRVINDSYHSYKPDNRYPIIVLNIEVDPILIDVNIHPTKMDIKFSKFNELTTLIEKMIKDKISKKNLIPHIEVEDEKIIEVENIKPRYEEITFNLNREVKEEEVAYDNEFLSDEEEMVLNDDFLDDDDLEIEKKEELPELYPVGLVHGTYIICQNDLGMYMIDQHAAKERINYEYYKEKLGNPRNDSIALLFPITIELTNSEYIVLKENFEILRNMRFEVEEFGINSIIIKAHPTWLPKGYEEEAIRKIIEIIVYKEKDFSITKFNESIATMLSCKMAIKANMNITMDEMESLIGDLRKCNNPYNCPHGRPTIIYYSNYDLEKLFKRSGFDKTM